MPFIQPSSPVSIEERQWRLRRLAQEWEVEEPPENTPLSRPSVSPSPTTPIEKTAGDDLAADDLLKRWRTQSAQAHTKSNGSSKDSGSGPMKQKRSFSISRGSNFTPKEIFETLHAHVANHGSPGVAEALIHKLLQAGGNLSNPQSTKSRTPFHLKRKSVSNDGTQQTQTRILQTAIEGDQEDMVALLAPYVAHDHVTLDTALPLALARGNPAIVSTLLSYGANLSSLPEGKFQFHQLCINGAHADLVSLLLRSDGKPPPEWISGAMVVAAARGNVEIVARLSPYADGSYDGAAALKAAIRGCRVDVSLAVLVGAYPPAKQHVNEAFQLLFTLENVPPTEKMSFTDILLLAGAEGDVVSEALVKACETEFHELIYRLLSGGASVEYNDAEVLKEAIRTGHLALLDLLLSETTALGPLTAGSLVSVIPKRTDPKVRHQLLTTFLRKGANGPPLSDALIDAVETQDVPCVKLLVSPHFAGTGRLQPRASHDLKRGPRSMTFEHHATADVNHKGGLALALAVKHGHMVILKALLTAKPSIEILAGVFPSIHDVLLGKKELRFQVTEAFLHAGVSGPCVHAALQKAIDEAPPARDEKLIKLLLHSDVDVSGQDGQPFLSAIAHRDADLLEQLLRKMPLTPRNAKNALEKAMAVEVTHPRRARMVGVLLQCGAADAVEKTVGEALVRVLQEQPATDLKLLEALLGVGKADVNMSMGDPMVLAVRNPDPKVLELMLQKGKPTTETMDMAVQTMANILSTQDKAAKLDSILKRTKKKEILNSLLASEVQSILRTPQDQRTLDVLKTLLAAGIDVNAHKAAALCHAVAAADPILTDILFSAKPTAASLQAAMPCALKIPDPTDRLAFTSKLLNAGAPASEANEALVYAVSAHPDDTPLINTLLARADTSDGEALQAAVKKGNAVLVELLLTRATRKHAPARVNESFSAAISITNPETRRSIVALLLKAGGASGPAVSDALVAACGAGDMNLGTLLLSHGAHVTGPCLVEACRAGAPDMLEMLLAHKSTLPPSDEPFEQAFQAATEVSDLHLRARIFHLLLEIGGVSGPVVDAQLVSASRFGEDARELVELLLRGGASVDFNDGEAVYNATRCAFLGILRMMLETKPKPQPATLLRALKACSKLSGAQARVQVLRWLFAAGLPVGEDVHVALNRAVNEDEVCLEVVEVLLSHGASPVALGCKSLVDVAVRMDETVLELFLKKQHDAIIISREDVSWAFEQTFTPGSVERWLSDGGAGLGVARRLVAAGACGEGLSGSLAAALDWISHAGERGEAAREFVGLVIGAGADVNRGQGEALVKATKTADAALVRRMMQQKPTAESLSMAFPYVFDHEVSEAEALQLVTMFTDYHDGETRLDPMFPHPDEEPVIFKALARYPRSIKIVQALLESGFYHDQMGRVKIFEEFEELEQANLLIWCLVQPQKRVSSGIITLLIDHGARVNFETSLSKSTPLMLAIREKRHDIVKHLILAGAEVDVVDATGNTPLTLTTQIGGELGTAMMASILAAEPSLNDGSLHNAARDLNIQAMQVLVEFGHEVDFPSPLHGGRTALGELCLNATTNNAVLTAAQEKAMEKAMTFLLKQGTDVSLLSDGKSILLLAMHSAQPLLTTRALLKVGLWKHINDASSFYHSADGYTYSPTQYAQRVLPPSDTTEQLHALLKANRGQDVYFASDGDRPQPDGAVGLPSELIRADRERKARLERLAREADDHARTLARTHEVASLQNQILAQRATLEDVRSRQKHATELDGLRDKAALESELFAAAVARQRAAAAEEARAEEEGRRKRLAYEVEMGEVRVGEAVQMNAVRRAEREDVNAFEKEQDGRVRGRIGEERRLIESKGQLAAQFAAMGVQQQRRQIGYISGELD